MINFEKYTARFYKIQAETISIPFAPPILALQEDSLSPKGLSEFSQAKKLYGLAMAQYEDAVRQKREKLEALKQDFKKNVFDELKWERCELGPIADLIFDQEWSEEMDNFRPPSSFRWIYFRCKDSKIIALIRSCYKLTVA